MSRHGRHRAPAVTLTEANTAAGPAGAGCPGRAPGRRASCSCWPSGAGDRRDRRRPHAGPAGRRRPGRLGAASTGELASTCGCRCGGSSPAGRRRHRASPALLAGCSAGARRPRLRPPGARACRCSASCPSSSSGSASASSRRWHWSPSARPSRSTSTPSRPSGRRRPARRGRHDLRADPSRARARGRPARRRRGVPRRPAVRADRRLADHDRAEQINTTSGLRLPDQRGPGLGPTDVIVLALAIYGLLGLLTDALVRFLERRLLAWRRGLEVVTAVGTTTGRPSAPTRPGARGPAARRRARRRGPRAPPPLRRPQVLAGVDLEIRRTSFAPCSGAAAPARPPSCARWPG